MLKFFLYFLTMSEDVRVGIIVFFVINRLIASAVSALMARRRGRTPWKWALTSLLLGWIGFIIVCVSKNITEEKTDNLDDSTLTIAIFLSIIITWATWSYVDRICLMPWIDTVEDFKDIFRGEPKKKQHDWLDYNVNAPRKTETPEEKRNREEWHELFEELRHNAAKDAERVREGMREAERNEAKGAEARKEEESERVNEDFNEIVRDIREYYTEVGKEFEESEIPLPPLSDIEAVMRKYKDEIVRDKREFGMRSVDAVSLLLYKHMSGHKDRFYYKTGEFELNYIDLNKRKQHKDVSTIPAEYYYDEVIEKDGKEYGVFYPEEIVAGWGYPADTVQVYGHAVKDYNADRLYFLGSR